jgi:hypothetical protein
MEARVVSVDLFGMSQEVLVTSAEAFWLNAFWTEYDVGSSRLEWCFDNLPYTGNLMLEEEDATIIREILLAYAAGLYILVIVGADALLERLFTDAIESKGDRRSARRGFGAILKSAEAIGIIDEFIIKRVSRIHAVRNNFVHEKGPDHELRLFRRMMKDRRFGQTATLLKEDAREALCLAYGVAGRIRRSFPRLAVDGMGESG